jgi:hypothetical protein
MSFHCRIEQQKRLFGFLETHSHNVRRNESSQCCFVWQLKGTGSDQQKFGRMVHPGDDLVDGWCVAILISMHTDEEMLTLPENIINPYLLQKDSSFFNGSQFLILLFFSNPASKNAWEQWFEILLKL